MSPVIKIPLPVGFYDEVDECFVDKDESAQKFVWRAVKDMVKDAKSAKMTNSCNVRKMKGDQMVSDSVSLTEYDLKDYVLAENPEWIPKDLEKDNVKHWEHQVTERSYDYIKKFGQITMLRFAVFNESTDKILEEKISKAQEKYDSAPEEQKESLLAVLNQEKEKQKTSKTNREEEVPTCLEQCIYNQVYPALHKKIIENMDLELDKEFEQVYPKVNGKEAKK